MTLIDNLQDIRSDVQRESKKASVHQLTVDIKGNQKNFNVLAENVEDAVSDFKRFVFDTERLIEGKHYQIVAIAGGYLTVDHITKYKSKKDMYKTAHTLTTTEKEKFAKDLLADAKKSNNK